MRNWRAGVPSAGFLLLVLSAAQAAEPERSELRYEMFGLAGIHIATNHTTVEQTADRYAITTDVESRGIAAIFVELTSHSEVLGRLRNDGLHPEAYRGEVHRNGVETLNRVDYAVDGTVFGRSTPPAETRSPVTPSLVQGTVDQLTAFFMVERRLADSRSCALVVPVYDGRRRYNLHFSDAAPEKPSAFAERDHVGAAQVCRMRREAIAGFRDESGRSEGAYAGKLWYARLRPDDAMVLVQMAFDTEFGTVTGHLAELLGRGVHFELSE
jgi:hypothetical protein